MNFGEALQALKDGFRVRRSVWEGYWFLAKNVWLAHDTVREPSTGHQMGGHTMDRLIVAALKDDEGFAPAQPYQEDILAEDWIIIE